jgi:ubiquinone/menaquinone biosynthesis C-methylase UbiE
MESDEETLRLDLKTDGQVTQNQALWAGIQPGMRVADLGFGSGKTTHYLHKLIQPDGTIVGVDISEERIKHASAHYSEEGIEYLCRNICEPLDDLGMFDFVWVRFVLEYYRSKSVDIVRNISSILKPGGILCLIDLDYNCLSHYGLPARLERSLYGAMTFLQDQWNFDPYAGRRLYSFLYDLAFEQLDVRVEPHHLIFGEPDPLSIFNWRLKVTVAGKKCGYPFDEYEEGFAGFLREFEEAFADPRRFTYTPLICCRGTLS